MTHIDSTIPTHPLYVDLVGKTDGALDREWLLTNSTGGFAMGTALGANTRRYHGLLIAATTPPVGRVVVLNQTLDRLELTSAGQTQVIDFSCLLFRDDQGQRVFAPDVSEIITRFDHGLECIWSYQWRGLTLTKRLTLHEDAQACTLRYDITGLGSVCDSAILRVSPMLTLRGFHEMSREGDSAFTVQNKGDSMCLSRGDLAGTYHMPRAVFEEGGDWWRDVMYPVETHRGSQDVEDFFLPGTFAIDLGTRDDAEACLTAALGTDPAAPQGVSQVRIKRLSEMSAAIGYVGNSCGQLAQALARAADDFVVCRDIKGKTLSTIIAGYPWFADWGRDTFIALPGLLLTTGRHDEARDTLRAFASAMRGGLVPNRFDDDDPEAAHYNTVDASLWFVHSALAYREASGDRANWDSWLGQACLDVVEAYREGTSAQSHDGRTIKIAMDSDHLIAAGDAQTQLTWMDAATRDDAGAFHVFTPRQGKCIEINALWYSALVGLSQSLPDALKTQRVACGELAKRVKQSFMQCFWSDSLGYFVDHVYTDAEGALVVDNELRPNQVIACALERSPVLPEHSAKVLAAVKQRLLTPVGLRTLPTDSPAFHSHYGGSAFERDKAYHQGTVWAWLIGPFVEAVLREGRFDATSREQAKQYLAPLCERLTTTSHPGGLGQLAEIYDPLEPFAPRGCPAQAWSVAEVLRVLTLIHGV